MSLRNYVTRIVSGGQTGVDRAALEVAIELQIAHGGWCPRGRRAEDGPISLTFRLRETPSKRCADRTEQNVLDSDATLILSRGELTGGSALTRNLARRHQKPLLVVNLDHEYEAGDVVAWLASLAPVELNVAGPRESTSPGITEQAKEFLRKVLKSEADEQFRIA